MKCQHRISPKGPDKRFDSLAIWVRYIQFWDTRDEKNDHRGQNGL